MSSPELIPNGVPLSATPGLTARQIQTLASSWIVTAQELVALAQCPEVVRGPLAQALGVDQAGLDAIAQAAQGIIPATRDLRSLQLGQEAGQADYGRGALLDESVVEDQRRALPSYAPPDTRGLLPPSVSLLDSLPVVRSQGARGTCVAHAVLAMREQLEIATGARADINLSEQFVYWWCKAHDGIPTTSGTYVSVAMACLATLGAPLEVLWPYVSGQQGSDEGQGPPPAACAQGDRAWRISRTIEFNPTDIAGIKACLAEGRTVAFAIPVFDSWYHAAATRQWGKITLPLPGETPDGGHAMTLVGFQDDAEAPGGGYFLVRNSWQPWAYDGVWRAGYGAIPYAYLKTHANAVFSAERIAGAEVYLRNAADDTGARPLAHPAWRSPDIWLRRRDLNLSGEHQTPEPGVENAVFVKIHNTGPAYAYNVSCKLLVAPLAPWVRPEEWQLIGSEIAVEIAPGSYVFGPFFWRPPAADPGQYAFRALLNDCAAHESPVYTPLAAENHLWQIELAPGQTGVITFDASPLTGQAQPNMLRIERDTASVGLLLTPLLSEASDSIAPRGRVDRIAADAAAGGTLLLTGERQRVQLTVTPAPEAPPGTRYTFVVAQFVGDLVAGRMPVVVTVVA